MTVTLDAALDKAHVYTDISAVHGLKAASGSEAEKIQATAKQFESMMLNLMLKAMRQANTAFAEGNMLNTNNTRFYEDMLDQQLSLSMTRKGGVGLAEMLAQQLTQDYQKAPVGGNRSLADYRSLTGNRSLTDNPRQLMPRKPEEAITAALSARETEALDQVEMLVDELWNDPLVAAQALPDEHLPSEKDEVTDQPLQFADPGEFTEVLWPAAQQAGTELGVDPKLLLAQAALETGWGKHMISSNGQPSFNLFGIKADSRWSGSSVQVETTEYRQGIKMKEQADFRVYQNYNESFRDYLSFLKGQSRYAQVLASGDEPKAYTEALQSAGYATDPDYANKIFRIYQQMGDFPPASHSPAADMPLTSATSATSGSGR